MVTPCLESIAALILYTMTLVWVVHYRHSSAMAWRLGSVRD